MLKSQNIFISLGILFILEFYVYQGFSTLVKNSLWKKIYWIATLFIYIGLLFLVFTIDTTSPSPRNIQLFTSISLGLLVPKLLIAVFLIIDDVFRLLGFTLNIISKNDKHFPERRTFLSLIGFGIAGILSALVLDGIIFGKYRHYVRTVKIKIKNLPKSFKGYKVIQISDVHSGSFSHPEKLKKAIELINQQNPDLILFTGDMVNSIAEEFEPFVPLFSGLNAFDGKFAVLGNHDYGTYFYKTKQESIENVNKLIELENKAGFQVLRNEHISIDKNGEKLYILGVENWGVPPFPQFGDLDKAVAGIPKDAAKILMSHDPTHFDKIVKQHPSDIALTLSGHTHGMQFGLDLKNIKWSPVQYKYPKWADLYESMGKYLYVNRGFGVIGYPGRVGVAPEITLFILE